MSIYKYWWHPNVVRAIRQYPALVSAKEDKQTQAMTANYNAMPRSGGVHRTSEDVALRQLSDREEEIVYAVGKAVEEIKNHQDGQDVLTIVRLVDWKRTHTTDGAAMALHMSERTARSRRNRFIYTVAKYMHYL